MGWLERLLGLNGGMPEIPAPTPRRLSTGNAQIDRASEMMPLEQRRKLQELRGKGRVSVQAAGESYPWQKKGVGSLRGAWDPNTEELSVNAEMMTRNPEDLARTLTHEATHAMQPKGRPMRDDLPPEWITMGPNPYRDNPLEVEARLAADQVALLKALRSK